MALSPLLFSTFHVPFHRYLSTALSTPSNSLLCQNTHTESLVIFATAPLRSRAKNMQNIPGHVAVAHKSCHSCRRSRLHCDRLYPHCEKCKHRGVECLGYEKLFLWTGAIASRGKLAGQTSTALLCTSGKQRRRKAGATKTASQPAAGSETAAYDAQHRFQPPSSGVRMHTLVDPSFQDMTLSSRRYLDYCESITLQ